MRIKKNWVSAQIEEKITSTKQFDWEKTWVSPTHAQVGSHLILSASWSLSRGYLALPCWKHVVLVELKHLSWCFSSSWFFSPSFFSRFGKPSGSRIWIRFDLENSWGFLWIIGFHGGKFQFKLKSLRSKVISRNSYEYVLSRGRSHVPTFKQIVPFSNSVMTIPVLSKSQNSFCYRQDHRFILPIGPDM